MPITMVGLDATHKARIRPAEHERIRALGTPVGQMLGSLLDWYGATSMRRVSAEGPPIHDALAVAAVIRPDLLETQHVNVVVESAGTYTEGMTVCDLRAVPSVRRTPTWRSASTATPSWSC